MPSTCSGVFPAPKHDFLLSLQERAEMVYLGVLEPFDRKMLQAFQRIPGRDGSGRHGIQERG